MHHSYDRKTGHRGSMHAHNRRGSAHHRRGSAHRNSTFNNMNGLSLIDESFLDDELNSTPRRDVNVAAAKNEYRAQLANCIKIRHAMPHNVIPSSSESESESEESETDDSYDEGLGQDEATIQRHKRALGSMVANATGLFEHSKKSGGARTTLKVKHLDDYNEDEFKHLTPEKILEGERV